MSLVGLIVRSGLQSCRQTRAQLLRVGRAIPLEKLGITVFCKPHLSERPDRGIRPLILWGLRGLFFQGFCNSADAVVGVVEDLAGFDREPALEEEIVMDLAQLFPDLGIAELLGIAAAGQKEQGGERRPESKSRRLVQDSTTI